MTFDEDAIVASVSGRRRLNEDPAIQFTYLTGYYADDEGYTMNPIETSWQLVEARSSELEINLLFKNPLWISAGEIPD
jgi:hypothetical protein